MATNTPISGAHGDGIGPEIMAAALHILKEAGPAVTPKQIGDLVGRVVGLGLEVAMTQTLRNYGSLGRRLGHDGKAGFSLAQGQ